MQEMVITCYKDPGIYFVSARQICSLISCSCWQSIYWKFCIFIWIDIDQVIWILKVYTWTILVLIGSCHQTSCIFLLLLVSVGQRRKERNWDYYHFFSIAIINNKMPINRSSPNLLLFYIISYLILQWYYSFFSSFFFHDASLVP